MNKQACLLCVINIRCTLNNTLITVCDINGRFILSNATGILKIVGAQKKFPFSSQQLGYFCGSQVLNVGIRYAFVNLKGFGKGKKAVLKGLKLSNLKILRIQNSTSVIFNGCRYKKATRRK